MLRAWRIVKAKHAAGAFDGEGARLYGGRWNNPGVSIVYTAESQALAALELLANLEQAAVLEAYVAISVEFRESLVVALQPRALPSDWAAQPPPAAVRAIGDAWIERGTSAVLRVPSAIVPDEHNFLLNPLHRDFARLRIGRPRRFAFDPRIARRR